MVLAAIWPLTALSNQDYMAVEVTLGGSKLILASVYMVGDLGIPENQIRRVTGYATEKGLPMPIGCDPNARTRMSVGSCY